jgi:hypothetical protein
MKQFVSFSDEVHGKKQMASFADHAVNIFAGP